ncbi:MAG TPA: DUF4912 domain-containing protein [Leptolyngbyaceae cyanobacterium]
MPVCQAQSLLAQATSSQFKLPDSLPTGTKVRVGGSPSMAAITQALEGSFKSAYPGTEIQTNRGSSDEVIAALVAGDVDLAAIGRPLTQGEKAQGLSEVAISREKIAVIVSPENSLARGLTFEQFARIFRGEVTNWSEVGGTSGPIRFIDRPENSDTRQALSGYSVFKGKPFKVGATATQVNADDTAAVISALGKDGISYAIANHVLNQDGVKIVPMHGTLPDSPKYPYSQPRTYIYKGEPSPAVAAFLGYVTSSQGQSAIAQARLQEAAAVSSAIDAATSGTASSAPTPTATPDAAPTAAANASAAGANSADSNSVGTGSAETSLANATTASDPNAAQTNDRNGAPTWLWWLLPLVLLAALIWGLSRKRSADPEAAESVDPEPPVDPVNPMVGTAAIEAPPVAQPEAAPFSASVAAPQLDSAIAPPAEEPEVPVVPLTPETAADVEASAPAPVLEPLEASAPLEPVPLAEEPLVLADSSEALAPPVEEPIPTLPIAETVADVEAPASEPIEALAPEPIIEEPIIEPLEPSVEPLLEEPTSLDPLPLAEEPIILAASVEEAGIPPTAEAPAEVETPDLISTTEPLPEPTVERLEPVVEPVEEPISLEPLPLAEPSLVQPGEAVLEETPEEAAPEVEPESPTPSSPAAVAPAEPIASPPTMVPPPSLMPPLTPPTIAGAAGLAMGAAAMLNSEEESIIEASKYNVVGRPVEDLNLADVDQGLVELPDGYGESRIVLMPRDPQWAYVYWDVPNEQKEDRRRQGGQRLALRLYDVTDIDMVNQNPHSLQQYDCEELARDWYLPIPVSDRDYLAEIGYLTPDGRWLVLARSAPIHVPPVYPSDWVEDQFITVNWEENLRGQTFLTLTHPSQKTPKRYPIHETLFGLAQSTESMRAAGSLFGSMQHVPGSLMPQETMSSYVFPSGIGGWALPTASGALPTMSGIGFSASAPPIRPRKFWLVADAELIVYGATEPDATVTISGQPIKLSSDGTFRFQLSFQDGQINYPIMAVAADGEQTRSIHMDFERETPERRTNTREEAQDEWLP